jgi:uncharacterized surface protein with fasciclin (FAS1) repeats
MSTLAAFSSNFEDAAAICTERDICHQCASPFMVNGAFVINSDNVVANGIVNLIDNVLIL